MRSAVALALLLIFAGCSSGGDRSSFGPSAPQLRLRSAFPSPPPYLYVASPANKTYSKGSVEEFPLGSVVPIRTISAGIDAPSALAVDRAGNLYVANYEGSTVTVYAPGFTKPLRTIKKGIDYPRRLAFSHAGNLFVANQPSKSGDEPGSVTVYAPGKSTPLRTITKGVNEPSALAFDAADRLYVANFFYGRSGSSSASGAITVYAQGGSAPIRTITDGINTPTEMAFDSVGHLYVANYGTSYEINYPYQNGSVTVYGAKKSKLISTITAGVQNPSALAIDSQGVLYVTCNYNCTWGITEYEPATTKPIRTLAQSAWTLLTDGNDNLYAGSYSYVNVFAPGAVTPAYTMNRGANAMVLGYL